MDNKDKIILDLCGGSGSWSRPYKEAGYDVRLITLPEHDVLTYKPPEGVYGILSAPPCTEFSLAKNGSHRVRDLAVGMETIEACLRIIWDCQLHSKLQFWAMENPVGFLRQFLGVPHFTFEQWEFGDMQLKRTDIWGYFKEPRRKFKQKPDGLTQMFPNGRTNGRGWASPKCPPEYSHLRLDRAAIRAITPPGFAKAFHQANK